MEAGVGSDRVSEVFSGERSAYAGCIICVETDIASFGPPLSDFCKSTLLKSEFVLYYEQNMRTCIRLC